MCPKHILSKEYEKLYRNNLSEFINNLRWYEDENALTSDYSLFYPSIGKKFKDKPKLLVIGRALNGWGEECKFSIKYRSWDDEKIAAFTKNVISFSLEEKRGECPMKWLTNTEKYKGIAKSSFWGVIKKYVTEELNISEEKYTEVIAWSNLCKIAPFKSGNPEGIAWNAQFKGSVALFKQELIDLSPERVILITDLFNWAQYFLVAANIDFELSDDRKGIVEAIAEYNGTKILITSRPERKEWSVFSEKIAEYFKL
ncbi:hypothetical protein ACFLRZ_03970 [Bacteroidota bacterium]